MRERGFGRILFISSVAAFTGGIVGPHYAASKAGLHGLTHFLASRLAASGITVNALAPALVDQTGMLPGNPAQLRRQVPVGRLGRPSEVADSAAAIPGQCLPDQPGHLPRRRHPPQVGTGGIHHGVPIGIAEFPPITPSAATHDRCRHQDNDQYAACAVNQSAASPATT